MLKKMLSLYILATLAALAIGQEPSKDFNKIKKLNYSSKIYSCRIAGDGYLWGLNFGKTKIIKLGGLFIQEKIGTFSQYGSEGGPLLMKKDGENSFILKRDGKLNGRKNKHDSIADFSQTITLRPDSIRFDYAIKATKAFASSRTLPVKTRITVFAAPLLRRGYRVTWDNGKTKLDALPKEPQSRLLCWRNVSAFEIALTEDWLLSIKGTGKRTGIRFIGEPQNQTFILSIGDEYPYSSAQRDFKPGTEFKYGFTIKFSDSDE